MGKVPNALQKYIEDEGVYGKFRRVLRRADQEKLDSLFDLASQHFPAAEYVPHALPFEIMLLTMLLEEHKEVLKLREKVAALTVNNPKEHLPSL
jgi:hypothetical protein